MKVSEMKAGKLYRSTKPVGEVLPSDVDVIEIGHYTPPAFQVTPARKVAGETSSVIHERGKPVPMEYVKAVRIAL